MKKILKFCAALLAGCIGLGFVVSKLEKKKGWGDGHKPYGFYEKHIKRPLDFGLSLFALFFLWPVMLAAAILVKNKLGSPILFKQQRPGLDGGLFTVRKFRTMRDGSGSDEERLTAFGRKLRSTSIDELPELLNIIKGDMAVVGPRPLLVEYLPRYDERQKHRHDVRPGLTGLAQVNGRNELSWDEKFEDDLQYVNHITFLQDVKIIGDTIKTVLKREGIHSETSSTMEYFLGSKE